MTRCSSSQRVVEHSYGPMLAPNMHGPRCWSNPYDGCLNLKCVPGAKDQFWLPETTLRIALTLATLPHPNPAFGASPDEKATACGQVVAASDDKPREHVNSHTHIVEEIGRSVQQTMTTINFMHLHNICTRFLYHRLHISLDLARSSRWPCRV